MALKKVWRNLFGNGDKISVTELFPLPLAPKSPYGLGNDFNNFTEIGIYAAGSNLTLNKPVSGTVFGTLIVIPRGRYIDNYLTQIFISATAAVYIRVRWAGEWKTWDQIV